MNKYPSINGLRAISILFVIAHHLQIMDGVFNNLLQYQWLIPFVYFLADDYLGVNVFFVISSFLITSLLVEEEKQEGTISLKNFYIRRTLRIFPAYYFLLLVYFVLQLFGIIHLNGFSWLTSITYTKYINWWQDWFTAHAWSLSVEEQFYLLWPLLFLCGEKVRKNGAWVLMFVAPCFRLYSHYYPLSWMNEMTLFTRVDAIAIGCLIALYKDKILELLSPHFGKVFLFSLLGLFLLSNLPNINNRLNLKLDFIFVPIAYTYGTMANVFIGAILLYSVFGAKKIWFKVLNSKIFNFIGMLSYSIYLWQQLFLSNLNHWTTGFPQNLTFIFVAALLSFYCIEKPFLVLKEKFRN